MGVTMAANDAFTAGVRPGGLTNSTEIRLLLCYLVKNAGPITRTEIENALMEEALVNYFEIGSCLDDIARQQLVTVEGDRYTITDKGRRNGEICESSLAFSVRKKCDRNLAKVNAVLRRNAQVRSELLPREDGGVTLRLILDDDKGNLMTLDLLAVSEDQANQLADQFRLHPEALYENILQTLLGEPPL